MNTTKRILLSRPVRCLVLIELLLVLAYWINIACGEPRSLGSVFDLDGEANIHSWLSSAQLLTISLALWSTNLFQNGNRRPSRLFTNLLACGAMLLSLDETAQLHETVSGLVGGRFVDWMPALLMRHKEIPLLALICAGALVRYFFDDAVALWRSARRECTLILVGAVIVIAGGSVLEAAGHIWLQKASIAYRIEVSVEEFLEMFGETVALGAALALVRIRLQSALEQADPRPTKVMEELGLQ